MLRLIYAWISISPWGKSERWVYHCGKWIRGLNFKYETNLFSELAKLKKKKKIQQKQNKTEKQTQINHTFEHLYLRGILHETPPLFLSLLQTHTRARTHSLIYIYIYVCVCVCVCIRNKQAQLCLTNPSLSRLEFSCSFLTSIKKLAMFFL